jgi:hypothetical protein
MAHMVSFMLVSTPVQPFLLPQLMLFLNHMDIKLGQMSRVCA